MSVFPWEVTLYPEGYRGVIPKLFVFNDDIALENWLRKPVAQVKSYDKRQLPGWSPAIMQAGKSRSNRNVSTIVSMAFDIDETDLDWSGIVVQLEDIGCPFFIHTTWSHSLEAPRYRVVLFIDKPIPLEEYELVWVRVSELVPDVDVQCKDPSRYYVSPAVKEEDKSLYQWYFHSAGVPLDTESLMIGDQGGELTLDTLLRVGPSQFKAMRELIGGGAQKYKCSCPFQTGSSFGSAFVRVMKDGRAFLQCTSAGHNHDSPKFWLAQQKNKPARSRSRRGVTERRKILAELPSALRDYMLERVTYSAPQGCYYRHDESGWRIDLPWKREAVMAHFMGLMPEGYGEKHVYAAADEILSRQSFGFACNPEDGKFTEGPDGKCLNLYVAPTLKRESGDWNRINQIIHVVSGDNKDSYNWLMHWMAALIQRPERRSMVAVLALSQQKGVGKSMLGRILSEIIGPSNTASVQNRTLRDRFNGHYIVKLFIQADEVGIRKRDTDVMDEIKVYITDERVPCLVPYAPRTEVSNRTSWWLTSNRRMPVMVEEDDRRFSVFECAEVTSKYKRMLRGCFDLNRGKYRSTFLCEMSAFADHLQNFQVDWNLISSPIETEVRSRIQAASLGSCEAFCESLVEQGLSVMHTAYPPPAQFRVDIGALVSACPCRMLFGIYREWCHQHGRRDIKAESYFRLTVQSKFRSKIQRIRVAGLLLDLYKNLPASQASAGTVVEFSVKD